jgi:glycosyltransferase involved in cell wall biosynthesis
MLAIVIPYYKYTFFEATLESLANQINKRFKVYIGDDCSPEHPTDLLEKYKDQFDLVYHRFDTNLGSISLVQQWERCIDKTGTEEWIMILGDDDTLSVNCVSSFYANLAEVEQQKINVIRFATVVINQDNEKISTVHKHPKIEKSIDFLIRRFQGGTRSSLSEYVFRKSALVQIRFKDLPLAWYADLLAVVEVSEFNLIFTINEAVVYFRLSGLNITSRNDNSLQKNIASFHFYYYLLKNKMSFFNREQRIFLLMRLEKTFLDNKMNINFWMLFTKLYLSNGYFIRYFTFLNTMIKAIYKKINKG